MGWRREEGGGRVGGRDRREEGGKVEWRREEGGREGGMEVGGRR